jgi:hypothetical protein
LARDRSDGRIISNSNLANATAGETLFNTATAYVKTRLCGILAVGTLIENTNQDHWQALPLYNNVMRNFLIWTSFYLERGVFSCFTFSSVIARASFRHVCAFE